jgi:hypothetical protein
MLDLLVRIGFYLIVGLALLVACVWYLRALVQEVSGRAEVVIAPFEIVGAADNKGLGVGLAHMLQARLRDIESEIADTKPAGATSTPVVPQAGPVPSTAPMPQLFTQPADLRINLLDPADVKISVAGVDVGGALPWMQSFLAAPRSLQLTLYQGRSASQVFGTLQAFGLHDQGLRITVQHEQDAVPMDKIIDAVAYEIARRRRAEGDDRRMRVLDGDEFQTLVEVMHEAALLNRRVADGRGALPEFQELQSRVSPLVEQVSDWAPLAYLAGTIAESAKDNEAASRYYGLAKQALQRDGDPQRLATRVEAKLNDLNRLLAATATDATPAANASPKQTIERYVRTATDYLNLLLGHNLPPPKVRFINKKDPPGALSFWDGQSVVVPPEAERTPDVVYREASWAHIMRVAGSEAAADFESPVLAILYAYADILPMMIQQHETQQTATSSKWELVAAFGGGPDQSYLSFAHLGTASGGSSGRTYAAHMKDYNTTVAPAERMYVNSGIIDKAFYEAARRLGTDKAGMIWVKGLRAIKAAGKPDFQRFAFLLIDGASEADRPALREALLRVGLDPAPRTSAR